LRLGEGVYSIFVAIKNTGVLLLLSHLGVISLISLIVSVIFLFREGEEREGKKLSHYLSDIFGFLSVWLLVIFIGCILDGAIVLIAAFIVWLKSGAWPHWCSLSYLLPIIGVISASGHYLFLIVGLHYSKDRHDILLP
jgi:hypothetical protein